MIKIVEYDKKYAKQIAELFHNTIRVIASKDYSEEEIDAWAGKTIDYEKWANRLSSMKPLLAILNSQVLGFAELEKNGHIDCFYVHNDYQRQGVGRSLINKIKEVAKNIGKVLANKEGYHLVVVKSTVVSGTTEDVVIPILEKYSGKKAGSERSESPDHKAGQSIGIRPSTSKRTGI